MTSRRQFIKKTSTAAFTLAAIPSALAWALRAVAPGSQANDSAIVLPDADGLILRSYRFRDLETPVEYFNTWLTPVPRFFVRNHMHQPTEFGSDSWKLTIGGEVVKPYTLGLNALAKLKSHTVVNTLECAGNGRSLHRPQVPGVQWGKGAVGTARFSGPRLADVLDRAGIKVSSKHVAFRGADEVPSNVPPFIRSIPIEKALDPDTLIATHMNGAPLNKNHGFPARALVPGWIGAASCKWLTEITVLDKEFVGNFMSPGYRLPNTPVKPGETVKPEDTHSVTSLVVKSVIASPGDGASLKLGKLSIHGAAWAGEDSISRVDVSTDGGTTWSEAKLGSDEARYAWRLWKLDWKVAKPGAYTIMSRATDGHLRTQPAQAVWNPSGYLYNAVDQVTVHVS